MFKPYEQYKPSGVEWLGDVPVHWQVLPFTKYVADRSDYRGKTPEKTQDGVFLVTAKNVRMGFIDYQNSQEYVAADEYAKIMRRGLPKKGDILFTTEAPLGNVALVDREDIALAQRIIRFRIKPNYFCSAFALYGMMSDHFQVQLQSHSTGSTAEGLKASKLPMLRIVAPPAKEQKIIADFLDRETAKIDTLVAKKRTLIERLKEKRTALISRTVTRGLPPDAAQAAGLDPHPKLKPSGIDWLGDVPEHWNVRKFSREVQIAEGQVDPEVQPYASMLLIAPNHIESCTGQLIARETAADQGAESGKYLCRKREVIYSKIRPALAKVTIAPEDCLCSADMYPLNARARLVNRYLCWLLLSQQFTVWSALEADRVVMPKINRETLNELRMPVPPTAEQQAIADFLDGEAVKIDQMIAKVKAAIERLQEYRIALITAAVTGKIDVHLDAHPIHD